MKSCLFKYQASTEPLAVFDTAQDLAPDFLAPAEKIFCLAAVNTLAK